MSSAAYFTHKGFPFLMNIFTEKTLSYVENEFQVQDDDIFNVTYPKSGTNWMAQILGLIRHDGDPTWVRTVSVFDRNPWFGTVNGLKCSLKYPSPRLLASHLPFELFPKSFLNSQAKVIYTLRNPKDILVSQYHFSKVTKSWKDPGTTEEHLNEFLLGNVPFGSWFDHVKGWMQMKDRDNVFFMTYEELQQDPRGSVERICQFLGKQLNGPQIDSVVENATFQKMQENEMSNFTILPEIYMDHEKGKLLRKGICGDWKNHLTVAQSEHFDRVYQEKMRGVSMTFPWD